MLRRHMAAREARKVPLRPRHASSERYLDVPRRDQRRKDEDTVIGRTVELAQSTILPKLGRSYPKAIVLYGAAASSKVDSGLDFGRFCIQCVLQELQDDANQGHDGRGRLDLRDHVLGQRQNRSPTPSGAAWCCSWALVLRVHAVR